MYVLDFSGFWPIGDGFDFFVRHGEPIRRDDVSEVFDRVSVKYTFLRFDKQAMFSESSEHLSDMFPVRLQVLGKDKDVIEVDKDRDIQHVTKDTVDKALEGC